MRSFTACVLLLGFTTAIHVQFVPKGGKTLEEAYGPVADLPRDGVQLLSERAGRGVLPKHYHDVRTQGNCTFPIELYIIQDESGSFAENYEEMKRKQLKLLYDSISANHPGSTFGVGTHRDIPKWSLGDRNDYCWRFRLPLTSSYEELHSTYSNLFSSGGGDVPEWQFGAIIAACQSSTPGWSNPLALRLLVVATDAQPHFADDGFNKPEYNLTVSSGKFDEANAKEQCLAEYYPSPAQVADAISQRGAYVGFLIFDGEFNQGGLPINAWQWFNSYIGQSHEFVNSVQAGATDFGARLSEIISHLEDIECHAETTREPVTSEKVTSEPRDITSSTTVPGCPPCPGEDDCLCPAVKILLRDRPLHLRLEVDNEELPV